VSDHLDDVQLSRLLDSDLSLASRDAAIDHLRSCPACAARHDRLVSVTADLRLQPAVTWTASDTEATVRRLPRGRRRAKVTVAATISTAMCALVVVEAAPLIAAPLALMVALLGTGRALVTTAVGPEMELVLAVAVIAMLAPLAAYPLARWR
jgi:anti-sigma factor RsiW